ncbi:MAG: hypothetical protein M3350_09685 [Actinomycetota bacterium]|nr:hypothetical protein [Actinomycetota bacterium]
MRDNAEMIESQEGPPEGIPATGLMMLTDEENGNVLMVSLFDSEEDRAKGDETLKGMTPPADQGMGRLASVEMYEVALDLKASD